VGTTVRLVSGTGHRALLALAQELINLRVKQTVHEVLIFLAFKEQALKTHS
jgi:hypothetical protein